jgi:hypothetical protein
MKLVGSSHHGYMYFKYEHNTNYQKIQKRFLEAVDSLNHNSIIVSSQSENIVTLCSLVQVSVTTFTRHILSLFTQTVVHDERQSSNLCYSNFPWVWVCIFRFTVAIDIKFLFTMFKEGVEIYFLGLTDWCHM